MTESTHGVGARAWSKHSNPDISYESIKQGMITGKETPGASAEFFEGLRKTDSEFATRLGEATRLLRLGFNDARSNSADAKLLEKTLDSINAYLRYTHGVVMTPEQLWAYRHE